MRSRAFVRASLSSLLVAVLTACGGGGDSGSTTPSVSSTIATGPAGIWTGRTDAGRSLTGVVLDNGNYWVLYSSVNNSGVIAGAVQGAGVSSGSSFTSQTGKDFNLEGAGISDLSVSATYSAQSAFNGSLSYARGGAVSTFTSSYDNVYGQAVSLSSVAGTYSGTAGVADGTEGASVTIQSSGALSGSGASGCSFTGTLSSRPVGSVFNLSVTFRGGVCSNGTATVNGVGYYDPRTGRLFGAALNDARTNGLLFSGVKAGFVASSTAPSSTTSFGSSSSTVTATSSTSSSSGCGSRGGPGYRKANGDCASWADYYAGRR